jgi:outer membrane lipoprotein-sorting protein
MMMKCSDYEELLSAYANDELPRTQREFIEEHLAYCDTCRQTLAGYRNVRQTLGVLSHTPHNPDLSGGVMAGIKAAGKRTGRKWLQPALASLPIVAVMIALLVIQPWSANGGIESVLAKAAAAAEKIQSYRVANYSTSYSQQNEELGLEPGYTEALYEFVLPDQIHLTLRFTGYAGYNGVYTPMEGTMEILSVGEFMYSYTDNELFNPLPSDDSLRYLYSYIGSNPNKDHALSVLEYLDDLQQLPDEEIDGVPCLHYQGTPKLGYIMYLGSISYEIWIGQDDYLIRQMEQVIQSERATTVSTSRYYDFNADIDIQLPLDKYGDLLPDWQVEKIESISQSLIPVEEALAQLTGDEDWSDPDVIQAAFEMMLQVTDQVMYFNGLPDEAQQALSDSLKNPVARTVTVTTTGIPEDVTPITLTADD